MSYSLAIVNGDLLREGSSLSVVWGIDKLKQDLQLWVTERYGGDRFHPALGSTLQDYIGTVISPRTKAEIEYEVMRVLDNYGKVQNYGFKREPRRYSMSELLDTVKKVSVNVSFDTVSVAVSVISFARDDAVVKVTQGV